MGIIVKQAFFSSIFSYLGALLGFLNVTILMNRWLTPDELGLREILLTIAVLVSQLGGLGSTNSIVKFYPFFRIKGSTKDKGLLMIGALISFAGFILFGGLIFLFKNDIISRFNDDGTLFLDFFWLLFPLSFLLLSNSLLEGYIKSRSNITFPTFIKEVFHRILVLAILVCYYFKFFDYSIFILLFVFSYAISAAVCLVYLALKKQLDLRVDYDFFNRRLRKVFFNYSLFSIMSGFSNLLIAKIDILMIGFVLGFSSSAIYANAAYLSVLIFIPATAIAKISSPIIAHEFKLKRIVEIDKIYKKSSTNQLLLGGLIFILLMVNIDSFFELQRPEYKAGKFVLILLGGARVITMLFGVAGPIIHISKFYRFDTITSIILAFVTYLTNYIMIPIYGMEGAAFATMVSLSLFYCVRYVFIKKKIGIQPFTRNTLVVALILAGTFILGTYLPKIGNIYLDTMYRSIIVISFMGGLTIYFEVSEEINRLFRKSLKKIGM